MDDKEVVEILKNSDGVRIEKITSRGHVSPEGFWYDQTEDEWVALLKGDAVLEYKDGSEIKLATGDVLFLPAGKKHRIKYTSELPECVWLCVFTKT